MPRTDWRLAAVLPSSGSLNAASFPLKSSSVVTNVCRNFLSGVTRFETPSFQSFQVETLAYLD